MYRILACLALTACAHDFQLMKVEEQLGSYGAAIRWGYFEKAVEFQNRNAISQIDLSRLAKIRVTGYHPLSRREQDAGKTILQTVEIRYIHQDDLVERTLTDHQKWHYDGDKGLWILDSGLPAFR